MQIDGLWFRHPEEQRGLTEHYSEQDVWVNRDYCTREEKDVGVHPGRMASWVLC
jgi:hypothetical protein